MATKTTKTKATQYNQEFYKAVKTLSQRKSFTIDDVVAKVGNPPQGRKALGALMNAAANHLGLGIAGYVPAKSSSRRGALNIAWTR